METSFPIFNGGRIDDHFTDVTNYFQDFMKIIRE